MKITQGPLILLNIISPKYIQLKYENKHSVSYE
jgi:hypothetical protein